ncbi:MAG: hypothetical protein EOO73_17685 [Myxococcales bacterium]|nr:MAG: hypothetical protein EOO73_17685 [Myxococcales bacterium]
MTRRRCKLSSDAGAALLVLVTLGACRANEGRLAERPRPSLVSEASALPAFITPAVWRYHPPQPARVNAELQLAGGERVLAGRRGERWLVSKQGSEAASMLAPEELVGILTVPGGYIFVGASGVSYESRGPIAPFFRSSAPLEPLASVSSSGTSIVGIRRDRGLLRSEDGGATWKPAGPNGPKFVSVLLGAGGRGLALAVPESLFETRDGGQTFVPVPARSVGAFGVERLADGGYGVVSALGTFRYREGESEPLERVKEGAPSAPPDFKSPRGPDATALNEGRAAVSGGNYFELGLRDKAGGWQLISGRLGGALVTRSVAELSPCRAVRLAASERALTVACFRAGADAVTQPIELWTSQDGGRHFRAESAPLDGSLSSFRMALGSGGALLLAGVCPSYSAGAGCAPQGIVRRAKGEPSGSASAARSKASPKGVGEFRATATPSLADTALALAFSQDGKVAYAVGRRTKGGVLAVFVSRDGGRAFEAQELSLPTGDGSDGDERWESSASGVRVDALVPAEDGSVGLAVSRYRSRVWLVLDEAGRVLSVARPPEPRALLAVAGSRALAISPSSNEAWESLDGGASFQSLGRLPIELCSDDATCEAQVACTPGGCAIGSDISRLGWGGPAEDDSWAQPALGASAVDYSVPRLKTPISCTLDASPWQALEGATEFPTAFQASIGRAAWFASGSDGARASAWAWVAPGGGKRVERELLLAPSDRGKAYALAVSDQVEGVAALRYLVPDGSGSTHLTSVEVGWVNLFEGRARRVNVGDGGAYAPGDFARGARGFQEADPALLSIAEGGLYLRLHKAAGDNQPTLFFDSQRTETLPAVTWPTVGVRGTHSEMAHVDGEHVPLLLVGRGSGVVRARFQGATQELEAFANGALDPARFGLTQSSNIAYAGARAGQVIETFDSASAHAEAKLFTFRARGAVLNPPIDVPTQLSLPEKVERCSAATEASTPRVVAAPYPGTRHPVIVSDGSDAPQAFLTQYAVLHGTPVSPCVSSFDGEPIAVDGGTAPATRVLLPMTDLSHAYLFRANVQGQEARLEYHALSCKLDPSAEIPQELYRAPGALVPRVR